SKPYANSSTQSAILPPTPRSFISSSRASAQDNWRSRSKSNFPSAICRAALSRFGARNPILQFRKSASVKAAMLLGVGNEWDKAFTPEIGRDAFHRVPNFSGEESDAVERVLTTGSPNR